MSKVTYLYYKQMALPVTVLQIMLMSLLCITTARGQLGTECSLDEDCMPNQVCRLGSCHCNEGFVRYFRHCFKVRRYGERCYFDIQCSDHRLTCEAGKNNISVCTCMRFYQWDETIEECTNAVDIKAILALTEEQYDSQGKIQREAHQVFKGLIVAGLIVVTLGLISVTGCLIYGCCHLKCRRSQIRQPLLEKDANMRSQSSPVSPIPQFSPTEQRLEIPGTAGQCDNSHVQILVADDSLN